jgi:hypothetical protein
MKAQEANHDDATGPAARSGKYLERDKSGVGKGMGYIGVKSGKRRALLSRP